jgi:hypothetical protein
MTYAQLLTVFAYIAAAAVVYIVLSDYRGDV